MGRTSLEDLLQKLDEAKSKVTIGGKYYHYKSPNDYYIIVDIALYEETEEPCVVYRAEYGKNLTWIRPVTDFLAEVEKEDGSKCKRFTRV